MIDLRRPLRTQCVRALTRSFLDPRFVPAASKTEDEMGRHRGVVALCASLLLLSACQVMAASAQAAIGGGGLLQTGSASDLHHPYELFYGSLTLTDAGASTPYRTLDAFESQIRVS
jgi:hypothetical protein